MARISAENWSDIKDLVNNCRRAEDVDAVARHVVQLAGKEPPEKSPFPEISPAPWKSGEGDYDCWIFDKNTLPIGCVSDEANRVLMVAAPDMRNALYGLVREIRHKGDDCKYSRYATYNVLRAVGVNLAAM